MPRAGLAVSIAVFSLAAACGGEAEPGPPAGRLVVSVDDDLAIVGADGSGRRVVVAAPGPQLDADWLPDGELLVYRDPRHGINVDDEIYVARADGSGERNLTRDPANDWSPAWPPDGSRIAFASDREGELRIFVMDADGGGARRVTDIWGEYPAWSPDGEWIAFGSFAGGTGPTGDPDYDVFVIRADGTGLRRVTDDPAYDMYPSWSPDGESIAFESTRATPEDFEPPPYDLERTADFDVFVVPSGGRRSAERHARSGAQPEVPRLVAGRGVACRRRARRGRLRGGRRGGDTPRCRAGGNFPARAPESG